MAAPHRGVHVQKHLRDQDLVDPRAVIGQRHQQDFDMPLCCPMLGRDEQALRIEGTTFAHTFVIERQDVPLVFRSWQDLIEIPACRVYTECVVIFGPDKAIAVAALGQHFNDHQDRQQLRDIHGIDIAASGQP